jgi:C_GCAxxG_C_C family probable redox protein
MGKRAEEALALFGEGYNCAQSLAAAFAPPGWQGEACGAVTGALMALGLSLGPRGPREKIARLRLKRSTEKFIKRFTAMHGTINCNALRGQPPAGGFRKGREEGCPGIVRDAALILEEMIKG